MYIITSIICNLDAKGIHVKSEAALNDILTVMKLIFTPINSMIVLASLGNVFGKIKDRSIEPNKAGMRIIIIVLIFILILIFETGYIGNFINNLLG